MSKICKALLFITLLWPALLPAQSASFPRVEFVTTAGTFVVELNQERAPLTVKNFLELAKTGFYTNTIFHRVVAGFVAQGGGYTAELGHKLSGIAVVNESGNGLPNRRGSIAMARTAEPHSADSQFYINLADNAALDPKPTRWGYAVFGEVVEGMDVVDGIGHSPTGPAGEFASDVPVTPIVIKSARVLNSDIAAPAKTAPPAF